MIAVQQLPDAQSHYQTQKLEFQFCFVSAEAAILPSEGAVYAWFVA
jgi:hypothetical protein